MDWNDISKKLREPFPAEDIEWRIGRAGKRNGKVWAMALAYVTARAIQERLDDVVGAGNWQTRIRELGDGGFLFGIGIRGEDGEWIWKWNGAQRTDIEGTKGGISGAEKRTGAAGWGIGRYLYNLSETFVETSPTKGGKFTEYGKADGEVFYWAIPQLPAWALPGGSGKPGKAPAPAPAPAPKPAPPALDKYKIDDPEFVPLKSVVAQIQVAKTYDEGKKFAESMYAKKPRHDVDEWMNAVLKHEMEELKRRLAA